MPDDGLGDRPLLSPRGVTKRYGGVHALGGVDFSLARERSTRSSVRTARVNRR